MAIPEGEYACNMFYPDEDDANLCMFCNREKKWHDLRLEREQNG